MSLKASLLLDGQLPVSEAKSALAELDQGLSGRDCFTVYGLIGDALRGNSTPDDGFSRRIFERLRDGKARMEAGYDPLAGTGGKER